MTSYWGSGTVVATLPRPKTVTVCWPRMLPSSSFQRVTGHELPWCPSMTACRNGSVLLVVCDLTVTRFSSPEHTSFFSSTISSMTGGGSAGPALGAAEGEPGATFMPNIVGGLDPPTPPWLDADSSGAP